MGRYLSCNAEIAIATCDSYNWELIRKPKNKLSKRPFKIVEFSFSDLESATDGFSPRNLLGKGSHGFVYRANLCQGKLVAAVKKTKQGNAATFPAVENEIEVLSHVYHPRIVNLLGFSDVPKGICASKLIVVEYMPNGSLFELLHGSGKPPGWTRRFRLALQVARAVQFLHGSNPPVIHRDIKSSNVLIDSGCNARLGDFGLALRGHVEDVKVKSTPPAGTLGYLDPGYLAPGDLSTKSDVFSFGILVLEIISGRNAIDMNYSPPSVVDWALPAIKQGDIAGICDPRIGQPEDMEAIRQVAMTVARCVRSTAAKRPAMAEVVECLKAAYGRLKMNSRIWRGMGCRVDRVVRYEPSDDVTDAMKTSRAGSRKNKKVSSVASAGLRRSKSVGCFREIEYAPLDSNNLALTVSTRRRARLVAIRPTRLSKSKSMGILHSRVNGKTLEESKLLTDLENEK